MNTPVQTTAPMAQGTAPSEQAQSNQAGEQYLAWKRWSDQDFGACTGEQARYFAWHVQRALGVPVRPGLRLLELGFGNGNFMGWAKSHGLEVLGVETNTSLVQRARSARFEAHSQLPVQVQPTNAAPQAHSQLPFDLIAAFDVMEHVALHELPALLRQLGALLNPRGRMLLRFPNAESPWGQWYQQGDITHVSALGLMRMRQLAAASGLQVLHHGERLPWQALAPGQRPMAALRHLRRRWFERSLRKLYGLDRGMDFSPNQLVVLGLSAPAP